MRRAMFMTVIWVAASVWLWSCAKSSEHNDGDGDGGTDTDADSDTDSDSDSDTDTDSDSDSDTDTDTDTDTDADAGAPDGGSTCEGAIEVPDEPLEWDFVSDWMYFTEDTFDGAMSGCEDNLGNTAWFEVPVPASYSVRVNLNQGAVSWVNFLTSCDATECAESDLASATNKPRWQNLTGSEQTVYVAVETNIALSSGVMDYTFERYEKHGDTCEDGIPMDEATTDTPQTETVPATDYELDTFPTGCGSTYGYYTGPDIWFDIPVPAATKMTFVGSAPGYSFMNGYSLDCDSCQLSQESYTGTSFTYTNTTAEVVDVHAYLQGYDATGNYTGTVSLLALPEGDTCIDAVDIASFPYTWSGTSTLFIHTCPAGICPGTSGPDVWHEVTVPADTVLRVEKTAGSSNAFIAAVSDCGGAPTVLNFVKAPGNPEILVWHNQSASPMTVYVVSGLVSSGTLTTTQFTFSLATPVAGDFCTNAIAVPQGSTAHYTGTWAALGDYFWGGTGCGDSDGAEVWFEVPVPSAQRLTVTELTGMDEVSLSLKNACGDGACEETSDTGILQYMNITSSPQTVYVTVDAAADTPAFAGYDVTFDWDVQPQGDLCANPIPINVTSSDVTWTSGDWADFTDTVTMLDASCEDADGRDVWFDVTVGPGRKLIAANNDLWTETRLHAVEDCGESEICTASAAETLYWYNESATNATVTIGLEAYDNATVAGGIDVTFSTEAIAPGDSCATAIDVNEAAVPWEDARSIAGFGSSWPNGVCEPASGNTVWYVIDVPDDRVVKVEELNSLDAVVYLAEDCPVLDTCLGSSDSPEFVNWYNTSGATQTVYAAVRGKTALSGTERTRVSISTAANGNFCSNAIPIDLTTVTTDDWTGNLSSFVDGFTGGAGCSGVVGPEVWFAVTVPAGNWVNATNEGATAVAIQALGSCSTNDCVVAGGSSTWWQNTSSSAATAYFVVEGDGVVTGALDLTFTRMTTPPEVELGDGTYDASLPMELYYNYSYSQSIYLSSEIYPGPIHEIGWDFNGGYSSTETIVVYMGHTTKSAFSSGSDWVPSSDLTQVYSGTITPSTAGWLMVELDTPFNYNGSDNLVVAVDKNTGTYYSYASDFYCTSTTTARSLQYYQDYGDILPSSPPSAYSTTAYIPNTRILY